MKNTAKNPYSRVHDALCYERSLLLEYVCAYCRALSIAPLSKYTSLFENMHYLRGHLINEAIENQHQIISTRLAAYLWDSLCFDIFHLLACRDVLGKSRAFSRVSNKKLDSAITNIDREYNMIKCNFSNRSNSNKRKPFAVDIIEKLLLDKKIARASREELELVGKLRPRIEELAVVRNALVHRKGLVIDKDRENRPRNRKPKAGFAFVSLEQLLAFAHDLDVYLAIVYSRVCRTVDLEPNIDLSTIQPYSYNSNTREGVA